MCKFHRPWKGDFGGGVEGPAAGRPRHELVGGDGGLCSLERVVRGGERYTSLLAADFR
jgi:hypothetical protein